MGIDYIVDAPCIPRDTLSLAEIAQRFKEREQAKSVVKWYRDNDDARSLSEIGFEVTRRTPDGAEETELRIAQDALDRAAVLDDIARQYAECDTLKFASFYECFGSINYPIENDTEIWLLEQLPGVESPILFLMLMRGVQEFGYTGEAARALRDNVGVYFQNPDTLARRYAEMDVTTDVLFEMTFQLGPIQPAHGAMLLLFYNAIPRIGFDPDTFMQLTRGQMTAERLLADFPFRHSISPEDSDSLQDIKQFLRALYHGLLLNTPILLDI
jgi:hypothetical protein